MFINHLYDLTTLIAILIIASLALCGWGRLTVRYIGVPRNNSFNTIDIWIGFAAIIVIVELLHLIYPVDWRMSLTLSTIGILALLVLEPIKWKGLLITKTIQSYPWLVISIVSIIFVWCSLAMQSPRNYDSGLYHFQSIRWLNEYPIIKGLGNLHGRLAFNQSYFTYLALFNVSPIWNKGYAAGGLFLLLLSLSTLIEAKLYEIKKGKWLLYPLIFALGTYASKSASPSPDLIIAMLQVVTFVLLIKLIHYDQPNSAPHLQSAICLYVLCTTIITIKLSGAMYALSFILVSIAFSYQLIISQKAMALKVIKLCSLAILLHLGRGIILSGAPLYPSSFGGVWSLDWAMPIDAVNSEANWIYSWARNAGHSPEEVLGNWKWFMPWLSSRNPTYLLMLGSPFLLFIIKRIQVRCFFNKPKNNYNTINIVYLPFLLSIVFWFFTAPDVRFLGLIPAIQTIFTVWLIVLHFYNKESLRYKKITTTLSSHLILLFVTILLLIIQSRNISLRGWQDIRQIKTEIKKTTSRLTINKPIKGDQCWNSPLPCTPYFNENLKTRGHVSEKNLKSGFSVETY